MDTTPRQSPAELGRLLMPLLRERQARAELQDLHCSLVLAPAGARPWDVPRPGRVG